MLKRSVQWQSLRNLFLLTVTLAVFMTGCGDKSPEVPTDNSTKNFEVEEKKVTKVSEEAKPAEETITVPISLNNKTFYDVKLPIDTKYATDYSKYIYGDDSSFTLQVLSGVTDSSFSSVTGINNPVTITQNCVRTKEGTRGTQDAAILLDEGKALVLRCYDSPIVFATILSSFVDKANEPYQQEFVIYKDPVIVLDKLVYTGKHTPTSIDKTELGRTCLFKFGDGFLYATKELSKFDDSKENMLRKLNVTSGTGIEETFSTEDIYYAKAGNFCMAVYRENYNTTIVIFGNGEEAKCNVIFLLNQITQSE